MTPLLPEAPSLARRIFVSPDRRLRSGWRLLLHALLTFALLIPFSIPVVLAVGVMMALGLAAGPLEILLEAVPTFLSFLAATFLARRLLDRRSFTSLGLRIHRRAWLDVGAGILIAAGMMAAILGVELAFGWTRIDGLAWQTQPAGEVAAGFLASLVLFVLVGIHEEIFSRGYQLQNLVEGLNLRWGLLVSSLIFALMHFFNPSAVWYSVLAGLTASGLFLAYGWIRTHELWLPIGLHIGWNLFEGPVFGFPVSGLQTSRLLLLTSTGPAWATGGAFGPEAGVVLLPGLAVGVLLIWAFTARRRPASTPSGESPASP
jgi:hypothetical protein